MRSVAGHAEHSSGANLCILGEIEALLIKTQETLTNKSGRRWALSWLKPERLPCIDAGVGQKYGSCLGGQGCFCNKILTLDTSECVI